MHDFKWKANRPNNTLHSGRAFFENVKNRNRITTCGSVSKFVSSISFN